MKISAGAVEREERVFVWPPRSPEIPLVCKEKGKKAPTPQPISARPGFWLYRQAQ
jgi:hypothetical protein